MVTEIATIDVKAGQEEAFAQAYLGVYPLLAASPGLLSSRMIRGVESSNRFVVIVEWESIEARIKNFVETDRYAQFSAVMTPMMARQPDVQHFVDCRPADS
jgi:heme-degrading monooxygenase HmoA